MRQNGKSVVVLGGGFAGIGCTKALAKKGFEVTLVDRNNYHQFQPLLYQVATAQAAPSDVAAPLRGLFRKTPNVMVKKLTVRSVDPSVPSVTTARGVTLAGDYLVLATGSAPNFFGTPGADEHAFPLYSLRDAERLRSRIFELFEEADTRPELIERGALNFVVVGGGPTGVETAGALADLIDEVLTIRFHDLDLSAAKVHLVEAGPDLLAPFSEKAHQYVASVLTARGVELRMGLSVTEIRADAVVLSDGSEILTRCVVWGGGVQAAPLDVPADLERGRGGRLMPQPDLTLPGFPRVYAVGDLANMADGAGGMHPQLGSVALQAGEWAAANIISDAAGKPRRPFEYHDKGIMAMIGRNAAIAEIGKKRHELHGHLAFASWLGLHATLMNGVRSRVDLFMAWSWDYFSKNRTPSLIDEDDSAIDWD